MGSPRSVQGRNEFKVGTHSFCVDTCFAADVGSYETCVFRNNDSGTNVEHYETAEQATAGHKKWVKQLKLTPAMKLADKIEYGL